MSETVRIQLFKEEMKFSAGHFTIFSSTSRENLHGHNFTLHVELVTRPSDEGLAFDYRLVKQKLAELCRGLNEIVLLPEKNPHLRIERDASGRVIARFADEEMIFLRRDVRLLPIRNITVEELAQHLLDEVASYARSALNGAVTGVAVRVYSGPGQSARVERELS